MDVVSSWKISWLEIFTRIDSLDFSSKFCDQFPYFRVFGKKREYLWEKIEEEKRTALFHIFDPKSFYLQTRHFRKSVRDTKDEDRWLRINLIGPDKKRGKLFEKNMLVFILNSNLGREKLMIFFIS